MSFGRLSRTTWPIDAAEVDFGFADFGVDGYKRFVLKEYQALNRLTADELVAFTEQAGFRGRGKSAATCELEIPDLCCWRGTRASGCSTTRFSCCCARSEDHGCATVQRASQRLPSVAHRAASAVIFSHHFHITGTRPPAWLHSDMVGGVAVMTFFTISGYLVTLSWLRDPRVLAFVAKRLVRLWPGKNGGGSAGARRCANFGPVFTTLSPVNSDACSHVEHWRNLLAGRGLRKLAGFFRPIHWLA